MYNIVSSDNPLYLSEYMPANLLLKYEDKQTILQENSIPSRLEKLLLVMRQECEVLAIEKELDDKVNVQMDKNQRDYYLREQLLIISEELGDAEDTRAEAEKYAQKIQDLHLDAASEEKLLKECERLGKMAGNQAEISVIRSYLDTVIGLPWHTNTKEDLNQAQDRKVQDHDHEGRPPALYGCQGPDHLPGRPSGGRQNLHCALRCRLHGPQLCPHEPWRRA